MTATDSDIWLHDNKYSAVLIDNITINLILSSNIKRIIKTTRLQLF